MTDTIFALSTPPGRSGVAVIRLSGAGSGAILDALAGKPRPRPREAALRRLRDRQNATLDRALVLWFPGPASFTGEDSAECHVHGGEAVIEGVFEALRAEGARPAEAGEFTRRAFENGKLDLTEAEGLADLIEAETEGQREQALAQMGGALKTLYEGWREDLIAILSAIEGEIDFPDEDDVPGALAATAGPGVGALIAALETHLDDDRRGEIVRRGFTIAIIGAPNAGKSSILNRLARREAAIVTDIPGTTRDIVEVRLVLAGFPVILADTAGLREASDRVEAEGVRRALERARDADLRLGVIDGTDKGARPPDALRDGDILIVNKSDLGASDSLGAIAVSATTGAGFDALEAELSARVAARLSRREAPALSRARHREAVEAALSALRRGRARLIDAPELAGEDVRLAIRAMESLTGRIDVEDVLDRVFSQFCIGK
ncbi:tRNA uridine-5-carboxymethylaminomethyl(34) synthesis GTPase MnmE [Hyphobacterium marinum]|uniref:tRNA modification GTPase MnmE n=1 Tax=Hyphobacterium marinum TaxID=3116574 RepID=A0ABU7LVS2_9PROT|nr:tRNA uridine-5-carboxymethylaminomethyl(34) synthesis GTPase MnmE [Hyphobacterium sp. Y6023]MEE2565367.1 tRNA uridine-5-carboxymethylaminomethyl(34) synthesis GTPase MnmE [Hyphobacterium sp. Y6023]